MSLQKITDKLITLIAVGMCVFQLLYGFLYAVSWDAAKEHSPGMRPGSGISLRIQRKGLRIQALEICRIYLVLP